MPKPKAGETRKDFMIRCIPEVIKEGKKTDASNSAYSALQSTDWYVVRKEEISTAIPSKITAYRTAVRLVCNSLKTAIDSASDVDAVAALY